ncbi:MAG: hypothetical protein JWM93_3421 [Frankiales bacterium]|nr:hypothetical protein [Frankiales bacterium]
MTKSFPTTISRGALLAAALAVTALTACTSSTSTQASPTGATAQSQTASPTPTTASTSASPSPTLSASPRPSVTTTSASPSPSATPTTTRTPAQTVREVVWNSAKLPIMCGGAVEMVQLKNGGGKTKDGLVVEFLDVTYGSAAGTDVAVVQLDCVGAHPGPVDAPVFRSGATGPEFLGFATMSLDRFDSAAVTKDGIVIHGVGYSDKAAGCCPDLSTTMTSTVRGNAVALQERDTAPLKGAKPGTECDVITQLDAQAADLAKQSRGHAATQSAPALAKVTTAVAAQRAQAFINVVRSQLQRGCP